MSLWSCPFDACHVAFPSKPLLDEHLQSVHIVEDSPHPQFNVVISAATPSSSDESSSCDSAQRVPSRDLPDVSAIIDLLGMPEDPLSTVGQVTDELLLSLSGQHRLREVKSVSLKDVGLSQFKSNQKLHLNEVKNIVELDLGHNYIADLEGVAELASLRVLKLNYNQIHSISSLFRLPNLKTLCVSHNYLRSIRGFPLFPRLKTLEIAHNRLISEEELFECLLKQPKLKVLSIDGNPLMRRTRHMRYRLIGKLQLRELDSEEITQLDYSIARSIDSGAREVAMRMRRGSAVEEMTVSKAEEMKTRLRDEVGFDFTFRRLLAALKLKLGTDYDSALNSLISRVHDRVIGDKPNLS